MKLNINCKGKKKKKFFFLLFLFCSLLQADSSALSFNAELFGYSNNLEYFSDYREGILYLGSEANLFFEYTPHPFVEVALGVHLKKDVGDEEFFTNPRPYFRTSYKRGGYAFNIGVLEYEDRHRLPDAILSEQVIYSDGIEEGIEFIFDYSAIYGNVWMSVIELNTPEHREHLDFGLYLENTFRKLKSSGMVYWDHYGGQLFAPDNDPVRNNINGSVNLQFTQPLKSKNSDMGSDFTFLGSSTTDLGSGYGFIVAPWWKLNSFRTTFSIYKGFDYHTWRGNSIYHTNDIYYYLQLDRTVSLRENVHFDWGVRFDFVDIPPSKYFDHFENQLWISLRTDFDVELFSRK